MNDIQNVDGVDDIAALQQLSERSEAIRSALRGRIIGQEAVVDALLTAIFAGGHVLLVGVPGLAKTLLVSSLAEALGWDFKRIQFTPDLMPSDITGTEILREDKTTGARDLQFVQGPIFTQLLLADEINRTPPKTQAALLESMQEHAVTAAGTSHALPDPFFVLATQNPIEQEGTYPLPEAQLDRFMLSVRVDYPSLEEEMAIAALDTVDRVAVEPVLAVETFLKLQALVRRIPVPEPALRLAVELCRATRADEGASDWVREHIAWGAGPRAAQALVAAARAHAALRGEPSVGIDTIRSVAPLVLAHRLVPSFSAAGRGIDGHALVAHILEQQSTAPVAV